MDNYLKLLEISDPQVGSRMPSPQLFSTFRMDTVLDAGKAVSGQGFTDHLNRDPPSNAPGIDGDVTYPTEALVHGAKPTVHSPATGKVISSGGTFGSVRIRDASGYEHRLLHMHLNYELPMGGRIFPLGKSVQKGDPIGKLGNVHPRRPIKDHVHYSIIAPDGTWLDPNRQLYDDTGAVRERYQRELFHRFKQQKNSPVYDRVGGPDTSTIA